MLPDPDNSSTSRVGSAAGGARRLPTGGRSRAWALDGPDGRRVAVKLTSPAAASREAAALARLAGLDLAPELIAHGDGVIVTALIDGEVLPLASVSERRARALGDAMARLHSVERHAEGTYDGWGEPARSLDDYRARRAAQIRGGASGELERALGRAPGGAPHESPDAAPFTLVHGDVWGGNVVWQGGRPTLVDWEFQRVGDPAEDLAYAVAMDDLPDHLVVALLEGYGRPDLLPVVRWWRPLLAAECGAWYATEGDARRAAAMRAQALRLTGG